MQRRATAAYVVFFILLGGAATGLVVTADSPQVTFEDPDVRVGPDDRFAVGDRQYEVAAVTAEPADSGGHGGGGGETVRSATLIWTDADATYSTTLEQNATVDRNGAHRVLVGEDRVVLERVQNRSAILRAAPAADNETVTRNGEQYVVIERNDSAELVPAADYFPAPERTEYEIGDRLTYRGNETTVDTVTDDAVELTWTAPRTTEVAVSHASNVTLNDRTYFAYIPANDTLLLESDHEVYDRQTDRIATFNERRNGLLGVGLLSAAAAALLTGMAYLPSRY